MREGEKEKINEGCRNEDEKKRLRKEKKEEVKREIYCGERRE
jgi:hypothetical protein